AAGCPDAAEQVAEAVHLGTSDRDHHVASAQISFRRGPLLREADDHDMLFHFAGIEPKPWPRRAAWAAGGDQIIENGFDQVDRHDHVEMFGRAFALARL